MKISPVSSNVTPGLDPNTQQPSNVQSMRSIRMNTIATPLSSPQQNLPIPPIGEDENSNQAAVEATQPLSPQLAHIAKQRRALQVKERELANREKELQSKPAGTIEISKLKSEPLRVLLENGVTYEQLTDALLSGQGQGQSYSEIADLKAKIDALEKGVDDRFTGEADNQRKQVLSEMEREASRLVQNSDEYELVREMGHLRDVTGLIERTYDSTGEVLDVSEALRLVEEELLSKYAPVTKFKKFQSSMGFPPQTQQRQVGMRTLTNRDTAQMPMSAKQRALAAFYGQKR